MVTIAETFGPFRRTVPRARGQDRTCISGPSRGSKANGQAMLRGAILDANARLDAFSRDPAQDDLNLYRYVKNNPINEADPSGRETETKWVYRIEVFRSRRWVTVYVGSADDYATRLNDSKHAQAALINDKSTRIRVKRFETELDVAASNRKTLLSARGEAKRSVEQLEMRKSATNGIPENNVINAAKAENVEIWKDRHNVRASSGWRTVKPAGTVGIKAFGVVGTLLDLKSGVEFLSQHEVSLSYIPIFEDSGGHFHYYPATFWRGGRKKYLDGDFEGQLKPLEAGDEEWLDTEVERRGESLREAAEQIARPWGMAGPRG